MDLPLTVQNTAILSIHNSATSLTKYIERDYILREAALCFRSSVNRHNVTSLFLHSSCCYYRILNVVLYLHFHFMRNLLTNSERHNLIDS